MKKNLKMLIALVLIFITFSGSALATDVNSLNEKGEQIKNEAEQANSELEQVQSELSSTMLELQTIDQKINDHEIETMQLKYKMDNLESSIIELEEELKNAQINFDKQQKLLEERLIAIYEAGETRFLDVLLQSKSLSDFISNVYLISEIIKYDNELLESVELEKISIETRKKTLESQQEQLKEARNSSEETEIMLANLKTVKNKYVSQLTLKEQELQTTIEQYNNEIKEIESEILRLTYLNMDSDYSGGIMAWPAPGYTTITSPFGMRLHPIFKVQRFHSGVDIGVPTGGRIIAANDGVVIKTTYTDAFGYMVMIDHGGGIITVYAHASEIVAELGQEVKKGDTVIKAGSTGWSTGPHLHFEVRVNGECVDPMTFLLKQN